MKSEISQAAKVGSVNIHFLAQADIPRILQDWRRIGHQGYMVLINPHSVMMCGRDSAMRQASQEADLVLPDGVGIVLAARILGYGKQYRVTGPALMLQVCDAGRQSGLRHFFYGGREGIAERLVEKLTDRFPGLQVAGTFCPPFKALTEQEDREVVAQINASNADVIWVGLGAPKQEAWMRAHVNRINATALIGVGAAFDFHSGNIPWAPRWVRSIGCEWAYRLAMEPRRMWRRNLDSPMFLSHVVAQAVGIRLRRLLGGAQPSVEAPPAQVPAEEAWDDMHLGGGGGAIAGAPPVSRPRATARTTVAGAA